MRIFSVSKNMLNILFIGILIRLVLIPFTAHPFDMWCWYGLYNKIIDGNIIGYMPPFWYFTMMPLAYIYKSLLTIFPNAKPIPMNSLPPELNPGSAWGIKYVPGPLFNTVVKAPFLIADILATIILYKMIFEATSSKDKAEKIALIFFLNPYLIWISAGWGMFDSLPMLFAIASLYFLLKRRIYLSSLSLVISIAYKLYAALLIIPITIYLIKRSGDFKNTIKDILSFYSIIIIGVLISIPIIPKLWSEGISLLLTKSYMGLTYWSFSLLTPIDSSITVPLSIFLMIFLLIIVYLKGLKMKFDKPLFELTAILSASLIALFLTYRTIPEQFFTWLLPFIAINSIEGRVENILYILSSAIAFLYSISNSVLPLFMLPSLQLAPWMKGVLVEAMDIIKPYRIKTDYSTLVTTPHICFGSIYLTVLGTIFSISLALILIETLYKPGKKIVYSLLSPFK